MSGLEIPGLVFGVVPIIFEALKSYSFIKGKLHTCRHYSDEVEEVAARLASSRTNFNNEVQLLRRCLKGKQQIGEIDDDVNGALQESYGSCIKTIDRTQKVLDKMKTEMMKFDELLMKKSQGNSIKRLRTVVRVVFNESKYEKFLSRLRERNNELSTFRLQIEALRQPDPPPTGICVRHKPLPARFSAIQLASRQLHTALSEAWQCDNVTQRGHYAKLCLDAEVADQVQLDLAISCQKLCSRDQSCNSIAQAHLWLYVQSSTVSIPRHLNIATTQVDGQVHASPLMNDSCTDSRTRRLKKKASTDLPSHSTREKKAKHVQWAALPNSTLDHTLVSDDLNNFIADLGQTKNFCDFLRDSYSTRPDPNEVHCVGYLQDSCFYKHSFYFRDAVTRPEFNGSARSSVQSIEGILERDVYDVIGVIDQLKMAHKLATAVLQYNATPWLPHHWRLSDLRYLGTTTVMDSIALRTLHLSSEFNKQPDAAQMQGIELVKDTATNQIRQGISNPTLFCLGVALIEIAYWSRIEGKMTKDDERNPVLAARRLQKDRSPPLGLEYQNIATKCLRCDFGFGDQLSEKGLQSAVYTNVVWELEELITKFTSLGIQ